MSNAGMPARLWLSFVCFTLQSFLPKVDVPAKQALACRAIPLENKDIKWPKTMNVTGYRDDPVVSFKVKETGEVKGVQLVRSSGSADIDEAVMKNLRTWKFKPQPGCGVRELQMSVTIHF